MGGYVYRGTQIPELAGRYLYADLCAGELRSIKLGIPFAGGDRAESAPGALNVPWSLGQDASCNLYVTNGRNEVDKIVGPPSSATPACPANPTNPTNHTKCKKKHKKKHHAAAAKKHKKKKCQRKKHKKKKKRK